MGCARGIIRGARRWGLCARRSKARRGEVKVARRPPHVVTEQSRNADVVDQGAGSTACSSGGVLLPLAVLLVLLLVVLFFLLAVLLLLGPSPLLSLFWWLAAAEEKSSGL